jgi:hypothetical protein
MSSALAPLAVMLRKNSTSSNSEPRMVLLDQSSTSGAHAPLLAPDGDYRAHPRRYHDRAGVSADVGGS